MIKITINAKYYDVKYVLQDYFNFEDYTEINDIYINKLHLDGDIMQFNDTSLFVAKTNKNDIKSTGIISINDIKCLYVELKDKSYKFIFE